MLIFLQISTVHMLIAVMLIKKISVLICFLKECLKENTEREITFDLHLRAIDLFLLKKEFIEEKYVCSFCALSIFYFVNTKYR